MVRHKTAAAPLTVQAMGGGGRGLTYSDTALAHDRFLSHSIRIALACTIQTKTSERSLPSSAYTGRFRIA